MFHISVKLSAISQRMHIQLLLPTLHHGYDNFTDTQIGTISPVLYVLNTILTVLITWSQRMGYIAKS